MTAIKNEFDHLLAFPSDGKVVLPKDLTGEKGPKLSGRILNVMAALPTRIYKTVDDESEEPYWKVEGVRGNSALYSSHFFLEQQTEWETHMIAWTGELLDKTPKGGLGDTVEDGTSQLKEEDKKALEKELRNAFGSPNIHPIWLLESDQTRWRNYAEKVLWPVFHYIQGQPSDGKAENEYWRTYLEFNQAYAEKIKAIYKPGDIIWIHDYYLTLLPQMLRIMIPDVIVGFFLHTPFPSSEYFRCLSKRNQILDGILGSDLVVFQTDSFQRHFVSCCSRLLGCEVKENKILIYGFNVSLGSLPIGIDAKKIEHDAFHGNLDIEEKVKALRNLYHDKRIIVGRDRLNSVRGVLQKLQAFEMFLQMYPEWRDKVLLIQVSTPGYSHSPKLEKKITELINHINSEYGSINWIPVLHYQKFINKDEYLALLRVADLALITSLRDGMNTTALEFVVCQKENNSPLILSEFSGTANVLRGAMVVNPWDAVGISKTINDCLKMLNDTKETLQRLLYRQVTSNTIQNWTNNFIKQLTKQISTSHSTHYTPALNSTKLLSDYHKSKKRLFLFDYDGTLTHIVKDPAAAIPSSRLNTILDTLSADPRNEIWLISGRDQAFLDKWFGAKKVGLSAEHGCFMKKLGSHEWVNLAETFNLSWQEKVAELFKEYTAKTPGTNLERKKVALTWHYRRADPELGEFQANRLKKFLVNDIASKYDVEVMAGKANLEVRPRSVNKGEIAKRLVLSHLDKSEDLLLNDISDKKDIDIDLTRLPDFMLCIGDDQTDEDMFRALNHIEREYFVTNAHKFDGHSYGIYTVAIGPASKQTVAKAHLTGPSQVLDTLGLLTGDAKPRGKST